MREIQTAENKTLKLTNVVSRRIQPEENMTGRITAVTIVLILLLNFIILFLSQLKNIRPKASQIHIQINILNLTPSFHTYRYYLNTDFANPSCNLIHIIPSDLRKRLRCRST